MNVFMFTVLDEKCGYVKVKKEEIVEAMQASYENGFEDGKRSAETRKETKSSKLLVIGGDEI